MNEDQMLSLTVLNMSGDVGVLEVPDSCQSAVSCLCILILYLSASSAETRWTDGVLCTVNLTRPDHVSMSFTPRCETGSVVDQNQVDLWSAASAPHGGGGSCQSDSGSGRTRAERHQTRSLLGHHGGAAKQRQVQVSVLLTAS